MALTKDKLTLLLQDRFGISRQESRQLVERFFKIMKDTLSQGKLAHQQLCGKFSVRQKRTGGGETLKPRRA